MFSPSHILYGIVGFWTVSCSATSVTPREDAWPNGPFTTNEQYIVDASGDSFTYAGVNWPGHLDVMIPEGLQYRSISDIMAMLKGLGINSIRLTYAIEMIDQIEDNAGQDVPIQAAFVDALGQGNGTAIFEKVLSLNPSFSNDTTRLEVFDAIAAEAQQNEIFIHLDNHLSKAGWCCTPLDHNGWWGDSDFPVANWTRGLSYMADHARAWPNFISMSLRNELREPFGNATLYATSYNWQDWYKYVKEGVEAISSANADVLIFLSGLESDTTLEPVTNETALRPGSGRFELDESTVNKIVLELHNYDNINKGPGLNNCTALEEELLSDGFQALQSDAPNKFPVVMTEFGFVQDDTTWQGTFASCIEEFLADQQAGWMIWSLGGSYYIREGVQDYDESWGLLSHDWSSWRSPGHINGSFATLVDATLASVGIQRGLSNDNGSNSSGNGTSENAGNVIMRPNFNLWSMGWLGLITALAIWFY